MKIILGLEVAWYVLQHVKHIYLWTILDQRISGRQQPLWLQAKQMRGIFLRMKHRQCLLCHWQSSGRLVWIQEMQLRKQRKVTTRGKEENSRWKWRIQTLDAHGYWYMTYQILISNARARMQPENICHAYNNYPVFWSFWRRSKWQSSHSVFGLANSLWPLCAMTTADPQPTDSKPNIADQQATLTTRRSNLRIL